MKFRSMTCSGEVAVIGAGIAGLACAYELSKAGLSVQVYESETAVGGRMSTRTRDGFSFDLGANFLIRAYPNLLALGEEMGVEVRNLSPVRHVFYRGGAFHDMNFSSARDVVRMHQLKFWSKLKFLEFVVNLKLRGEKIDFFDLSETPDEMNQKDAYTCASQDIGADFADYILDSFCSCMMFYRAKEVSEAAFLSLFRMKSDPAYDFSVLHAGGEMQELPDKLAARLQVRTSCPVLGLSRCGEGWRVATQDGEQTYPRVVLATTAGVARKLLREGPEPHRALVSKTRYARTVNLSYRIPAHTLGKIHCYYIPYVENKVVAEFTNEALKGADTTRDGESLVNVGLHEAAARRLWSLTDAELFAKVKAELVKIHPGLQAARPHDLQRWLEAMPKFSCGQVSRVKEFLRRHQGDGGLYLCGDYLNSPWLEGASRCGKRVARQLVNNYWPISVTAPGGDPKSDLP